jgi:hypothetical protein
MPVSAPNPDQARLISPELRQPGRFKADVLMPICPRLEESWWNANKGMVNCLEDMFYHWCDMEGILVP